MGTTPYFPITFAKLAEFFSFFVGITDRPMHTPSLQMCQETNEVLFLLRCIEVPSIDAYFNHEWKLLFSTSLLVSCKLCSVSEVNNFFSTSFLQL